MNVKLKGYRVMAGYTQEDIASALGISRSFYVLKENGGRKFSDIEETIVLRKLKEKIPELNKEDVFPL